jgi:hypothetical protein
VRGQQVSVVLRVEESRCPVRLACDWHPGGVEEACSLVEVDARDLEGCEVQEVVDCPDGGGVCVGDVSGSVALNQAEL